MKKILFAFVFVCLAALAGMPRPCFAGICPAGNQTINPDGSPQSINNVGVTGPIIGSITSCFYASQATGSDSNTGADESHPWKHVPGMSGCSSNCAGASVSAGNGFILRGGDTWTQGTDMNGLVSLWSGTSSHPIYWGVDQTWFNSSVCGATWCRPIFSTSSAMSNNMFHMVNESWNIMDDIEVVGMANNENGCQNVGGTNIRCTRLYFHAWTHTGSTNEVGFFAQCGSGSMIDHNVADGSDSSKNTFNGVYSGCGGTVQFNEFNYVVSCVLAGIDVLNGNICENSVESVDGDHCNGFYIYDANGDAGSTYYVYNNIQRTLQCSGGVNFWMARGAQCVGCVAYGFGNIIEASAVSGNVFSIGDHPSHGTNQGTYYIINNTVSALNGAECFGNGEASPRSVTNYANNHCIGTSVTCLNTGTTCNNLGGNVVQTLSAANAQGYSNTESEWYSPLSSCTSATCSTVKAGVNESTLCTGLITPMCTSTLYPVYNSTNHTIGTGVAPAGIARGTLWDAGAFEFSGSGLLLFPPTNLHVVSIN